MQQRSELFNLAVARMRKLFPQCSIVRQMDARAAEQIAIVPSRCRRKACVYPPHKDGLCRMHLQDMLSEYSILPSCAGAMTPQPQPHA